MRVGIVGLGGIAAMHICSYERIKGVEIVAAADALGEQARSYSLIKDSGVRIYTDFDVMIKNESLDLIDICAPTHLHESLAIKALNAGLHVICEKPMAQSSEGALRIAEAARSADKIFMTAQVIRFSSPYKYLAKLIKEKTLGNLVSLSTKRLSTIPEWRLGSMLTDATENGGVMIDLAIHDIDFIYSCLGEPDRICGVYHPVSKESVDNYVCANLTYGSATVNLLSGFYVAKIPFTCGFFAIFEKGYLSFIDGRLVENQKELREVDEIYPGEHEGINIEMSSCFVEEIEYFIECVKCGIKTERALPESTAGSLALAERIKRETLKL